VKITVLVDNKAMPGLTTEHGFSLWIESGEKKILFDLGQGKALWSNAERLGVDLSQADMLVFSHGHYDHTGGLSRLLSLKPNLDIYCEPRVLALRYSLSKDKVARDVSIPLDSSGAIATHIGEQIHWVQKPLWLSAEAGMTGEIPRVTSFEDTGGAFFRDAAGTKPDHIEDDQAMWFKTPKGLVIVFGCCHSGMVNSINYILQIVGEQRIHAIIGGLHLVNATKNRLTETCHVLKSLNVDEIIPCHCTGDAAVDFMRQALGDIVQPGCAGRIYSF